ncbi:MAG: YitT family protein [Lachnospiraceae bacterium]|nr:YitT family protein [Lachnospiraceae bacterium]
MKTAFSAKRIRQEINSFLMITVGAVIAAFSLEEFLAPNSIFDGGVVGIAMILDEFLPFDVGVLVVVINIPFLIISYKTIGRSFALKAVYSMVLFSFMTSIFGPMVNATQDKILATAFGGVLLGAGVGLVLRGGGCLDGTEIVALMLYRKYGYSVGNTILYINVAIYTIAGILFGLDNGMYSLLMYFITSKVIDMVDMGVNNAKSVMIITEEGQGLADEIYKQLGRTVTFLKGEGMVSRNQMDILYCVVNRAELFTLKGIINDFPGSSFSTVSEVSEIVGNHIKKTVIRKPAKKSDKAEPGADKVTDTGVNTGADKPEAEKDINKPE